MEGRGANDHIAQLPMNVKRSITLLLIIFLESKFPLDIRWHIILVEQFLLSLYFVAYLSKFMNEAERGYLDVAIFSGRADSISIWKISSNHSATDVLQWKS